MKLKSLFKILLFIFISAISTLSCYANLNSMGDKKIQSILDDFRLKSKAPAAVLSINFADNKIRNFVSGTVKKMTAEDPYSPKVTTQNLFQIGSITKSFTAVIILQLEAEGKLSIHDTIFDITQKYGPWLPKKEYEAWKTISIKQLLNMTSGIFDVTEDKTFMNILAKDPEKNWTPKEILKYALKHKPYFSPGMGWHYSNGTYNILDLLIEKVTKNSFETEINHRILRKCGLHNTFYLPYEYPKHIMDRVAHGYVFAGGEFSPPMKSGTDMTRFNLSAAGPSGALVSNSIDITEWERMLFSNQILPPAQLHELLTAVCMNDNKECRPGETLSPGSHSQGFSLGLSRMYDPDLGIIWVYLGETPGYTSGLMWLPQNHVGLAMTISGTSAQGQKLLKKLGEIAKLIKK